MSAGKLLAAPFTYRLYRPSHLRLALADVPGSARQPAREAAAHLEAAAGWLARAQDATAGSPGEGGVSAGYAFADGWLPAYPETSGYIVETLLAAADRLGHPELAGRAERILDWLLSLQTEEGAFPGHFGEPGRRPVIFNTGQIVHGLMTGHELLGREDCLPAAVRAARFMVAAQDEDGAFRRHVHHDVPHVYNTRAAWALHRAGTAANEPELTRAALRNIDWALTRQTASGWFRDNAFTAGVAPYTHTIAYAVRGILETGLLSGAERHVDAAERAAAALAGAARPDGSLAGAYDDGFVPRARYVCVTGVAQMVVVWFRLARERDRPELEAAARRGLEYVKTTQRITGKGGPADGGVPGSAPIWGAYSRFEFPNWAVKFFIDALLMADPPEDHG